MVGRRSFTGVDSRTAASQPVQASRSFLAYAVEAWRDPVLVLLIPTLLVLGLWHLDRYPRSWFDEGMYLQVAKNFSQQGLYAVRSADGTVDYAPIIGVGPTVLMPAALALQIGGVALDVARIIPLMALLAATSLLYLIARSLFGRLAAGCTLLLLASMPAIDWLATGRQLLGEVPAVALLLAGGVVAWRGRGRLTPIVGGVLFGLVLMTKGQYLLVLPAAICAIALFDRLVTRQRSVYWHAVLLASALATYCCWLVALLSFLNQGQIVENFQHLRASSGGALLVFNRERAIDGLRLVLGPRGFLLVVPATAYGLWLTWRASGERRLALAAIWIFQTLWLGWFVFASIAWPRYVFPALVLNTIYMGDLVARCGLAVSGGLLRRQRRPVLAIGAVALALLALLVGRGLWSSLAPLALADQREPQRFAVQIEQIVPAGAVIDGWEPEIGFLVDRPMQHPPLGTLDRVVRARWLGATSSPAALDLSDRLRGDYLIVGPFARWVGVYNAAIVSPNTHLVARVGEYELYRRDKGAASTAPGSGAP